MNRPLLVITWILADMFVVVPIPRDGKDDLAKSLIGKWKLVSAEDGKKRIPQTDIDAARIYIEVNSTVITFYERGEKTQTVTYSVKSDKKPHQLDLIHDEDKINHAIFSINNGMLTICSSNKFRPNSPEGRPDSFDVTSKKNATLSGLEVWVLSLEK